MTIRNKIISLFTSLTAAITILLSILIYLFTAKYVDKDFYQRITVRAGIAGQARFEASENNIDFYNSIREKHLQRLPEEKEYFFDSLTPHSIPALLKETLDTDRYNTLLGEGSVRFKNKNISYVGIVYHQGQLKRIIFLSAINLQGAELLFDLKKNLLTGVIAAITLVYIMCFLLSKQIVNPIRHIIKNVQKITASNLHLRLKAKTGKDEIAALTQTFNDMLDRLETAFETQNNFLNKAAHELRTPLTSIIGEAELALNAPRSNEEYIKALQIISDQAEQLEHHTGSLLELAQAGNNSKEHFMTPVRLDELLYSIKLLINFTEPGNNVQIELDELPEAENWITISGNMNLLKLALANIVQNACKYSSLKPVHISLKADGINCEIKIIDEGIGIPENELKDIFNPFFRASNTEGFKGYGIGLSLSQKIIRLHRGQLAYTSKINEGTIVRVSFPSVS